MDTLRTTILLAATLTLGLMAGLFYAYAGSVPRAHAGRHVRGQHPARRPAGRGRSGRSDRRPGPGAGRRVRWNVVRACSSTGAFAAACWALLRHGGP
jgi:uncharacterized membrane protein